MSDKKTILIVDDEIAVRDLLKNFLEEKNFDILVAETGPQAIEILEKQIPDLMITDLLLPGEHGIDLVKSIKDKYFIPIIVVSGIYEKAELDDFIESYYVDGFFQKPFNLDLVYKKINSLLNE